jgi:hypothetical protein
MRSPPPRERADVTVLVLLVKHSLGFCSSVVLSVPTVYCAHVYSATREP